MPGSLSASGYRLSKPVWSAYYQLVMATTSPSVSDRVSRVIEALRGGVQSDGGDIELVEVTADGVVKIRLHGACVGCPSSSMTLKVGIERSLKEHIPEVRLVEAVD